MRNIKLTVAYDGTGYYGFQEQRGTGLPTIQETLEKTISKMAGNYIQIYGAGRTDSGVHARGQVISFDSGTWPIPTEKIVPALNSVLPDDIVVLNAENVMPSFHARFSALGKDYIYVIYNDRIPSPFETRYSYFTPTKLNVKDMQEAASYLEGTHDFKAFQAANSKVKSTVRTIYCTKVMKHEKKIFFLISGDGFLYNMVRIIVGTLLQVGTGKILPSRLPEIIASRDRAMAGPTAPAHGLFLNRVYYDIMPEKIDFLGLDL